MKVIIVGDAVVSTGFALPGQAGSSALFLSALDAGVAVSLSCGWVDVEMLAQ